MSSGSVKNVTYKLLTYKSYTVEPQLSNIIHSKIIFKY